ncbi:MAG: PilZ domain-containing protein [Desulfobacterales bacterium]
MSHGGVFIQTNGNFYVDQEITMTFSIPKSENDITVNGKVVRADSKGIGVKFDELLPEV